MNNLNLMTAVGRTGYGVVGKNILQELVKQNVEVSLFLIGNDPCAEDQEQYDIIKQAISNGHNAFDSNSPCIKIWHQFDLGVRVGSGRYAAFPIFELDSFAPNELHHLKYPDKLFVCSKWAQDVIKNHLPNADTSVVPLGINPGIFYPRGREEVQKDKTYTFIHIGKWEVRKGHDVIVELFNDAFSEDDDVRLWLMPFNPFLKKEEHDEWVNVYKNSKLGHKINILPHVGSHKEVAQIISQADCGLFPARAEGWNLELLEVMSMGKPVITTNYSGHTEFCTEKNSYLIDICNLESAYDGKWFFNQGRWAQIGDKQKEQCIEHMRMLYKNRPYNKEGVITGKQFTWKHSAECCIAEILIV